MPKISKLTVNGTTYELGGEEVAELHAEVGKLADAEGLTAVKNVEVIRNDNLATTIIEGKIVNMNTGVEFEFAGWKSTDFIEVEPGETYSVSYNNSYSVYYDENKVWVANATFTAAGQNPDGIVYYHTVAPENAKYVRFSFSDGIPVIVTKGTELSDEMITEETITGYYVDNFNSTAGKKMVLFGDSITQTHNVSEDGLTFSYSRNNYPFYLCEKLGCTFKNFAKDGASYKTNALSFYQCIQNQIAKCIETIPQEDVDIIVVSAGTNDGVGNVGTYDAAMNAEIEEVDKSTLYGALRYCFYQLRNAYPNAAIYCGVPIQRADKTLAYQSPMTTAIRTMAKEYNLILVDGELESGILKDFEIWGGNGRYLRDGLHPNEDGMKKLADLYYRVIRNTYVL